MIGYTEVFPSKGPLIGRKYVPVPDAEVAAATGASGWATELIPGTALYTYPEAPWDDAWVIPGYTPATEPEPEPPPVPQPVPVLSLWNTDPAQVVVASADIGKFANGDVVTMAGVAAPYAFVNGAQTIANVGSPANHFELVGVDLSAAPANIGDAGMTATPPTPPATTTITYGSTGITNKTTSR